MKEQPSTLQEAANAAYVWRVTCQVALHECAHKAASNFDEVEWHFLRYKRAHQKEIAADKRLKKSNQKAK